MIKNPKEIAEKGIIKNIEGSVGKFEVQQNGIDLTLESISIITGGYLLLDDRKSNSVPLPCSTSGVYNLQPGSAYAVEFEQEVEVPEDMCAQIIQRSTLNRMGAFMIAGLYDSGFKNRVGAVLRCNAPIQVQKGVRVAQIIFQKADAASLYSGIYNRKDI